MTSRRLAFIHVLIAGVIGASSYDIVTGQDHWPFSSYPMFAGVHRTQLFEWPRLFGVTPDGREVPLLGDDLLWPFDQSRLPLGLRTMYRSQGSGPRMSAALQDCLVRYEQRRRAGRHHGPALTGVRLYFLTWPLDPYGANLERPTRRTLVAEVAGTR